MTPSRCHIQRHHHHRRRHHHHHHHHRRRRRRRRRHRHRHRHHHHHHHHDITTSLSHKFLSADISIIEALYRRGGVFAFLFIVFGSTALLVVFVICCICYIRSRRLGDTGDQREKYQPHERPNSDLAAGHCISAVQKS